MSEKKMGTLIPPWTNDPSLRSARPRDASTVLVLREDELRRKIEVFMVRRHGKASFMGGLWVFPGGKVDAADSEPSILARSDQRDIESCLVRLDETPGSPLSAELAFASHVAAARELFEEAGVLIAGRASGDSIDMEPLEPWRIALQDGKATLAEMLEEEDLVLELDRLRYFAHWITPSAEPMRFDTRFFAVNLPEGQEPLFDRKETTDGSWRDADETLAAHARGEITLAPPTIRHLEELAIHQDLESFSREMARRPAAPILPKMVMDGETMLVVLPWDPDYGSMEGESLDLGATPHPWTALGGPSRFVLRDGRFFSAG